MAFAALQEASEELAQPTIAFAQKLLQTPSISGQEGDVAQLMLTEMRKLDYDEVFADAVGNAVGIIQGSGGGKNVMFNCHMDHVDAGRRELWQYDPYGGEIAEGYLHGRGACDVKGSIASQIYGVALIKRLNLPHRGDIQVTGVVEEECGEAVGTQHLCDVTYKERGITCDFVVLGEPTGLNVSLGHRGRVELEVQTFGRTSHGSAPHRGINAVYKMVPVIQKLQELVPTLLTHPVFGQGTLALTIISCSPGRLSVVPDVCTVCFDRRFAPPERPEELLTQAQAMLHEIKESDAEFSAAVKIREVEEVSYTGIRRNMRKILYPWLTQESHPLVMKTVEALHQVGQRPQFITWAFGTDGSHTAATLGIPTIGYAPGEEPYAHTPQERVSLELLVKSVVGNAAIALAVTE